jgi:hypothetical protein
MKKTALKFTVWCWFAVASFLSGCFTLYKGIDKMTNYYNGEYSSNLVNAYVGGDAYNYIINGTYATAFFVLTAMFVLAAVGFVIIHYLSKKNDISANVEEKPDLTDIPEL